MRFAKIFTWFNHKKCGVKNLNTGKIAMTSRGNRFPPPPPRRSKLFAKDLNLQIQADPTFLMVVYFQKTACLGEKRQ